MYQTTTTTNNLDNSMSKSSFFITLLNKYKEICFILIIGIIAIVLYFSNKSFIKRKKTGGS